MKKKLVLVAIATLLVIGLVACGTTEPSGDTSKNEDNTEIVNGEENHKEEDNKEDNKEEEQVEYELTEEGIIKPEFAEEIIKETVDRLIHAVSEKDAETISDFVHPDKGIRFTPYTHVSLEDDIVFNQEEMKDFFKDEEVYLWGHYDGKGHEISLTPAEYYEEFIYSEDFTEAEEIGYNEILSSGNMLENQFEVYEKPIVVEYYFSGFDPDYVGMDWRSLRLVFEEYEGDWKLVGMIHNQWTI
ncbi:MAG: hypothetical protein JJT76_06190 [Clostridiaceae bacterium]|nr:hypothetical protein [Clostridiaceae bacterium]